jgi:hypothetical protein
VRRSWGEEGLPLPRSIDCVEKKIPMSFQRLLLRPWENSREVTVSIAFVHGDVTSPDSLEGNNEDCKCA